MSFDAFLKIDGIDGESTDAKHKGEIEILSFHWGITNPERGRARIENFQVVKSLDLASPLLFDAVCSGDHIKEAQFTLRKAGGDQEDYYKIRMEDVLITSQTPAGNTGGDAVPMEQVSLSFTKAEVEYRPQDARGALGDWVKSSCSPRQRGA
jgi:type VI secretion system secreted protein Hcp